MPIRAFKLPADIPILVDLIPPCFQYPENEEWSVQPDEVESFVDSLNGIRHIWPLFRLMQLLSPSLRDVCRGYVWEEDGKPVGLTNVLRRGTTDQWIIGNVAVLPEYRRRGIARKLVEACLKLARERGAESITLDVVVGNVPAYNLYRKLGFEHYTGGAELVYEQDGQLAELLLPDGYTLAPLSLFDWRPRYELALRIAPDVVQKYTPVEEGAFRQPALLRPLMPVIRRGMGFKPQAFVVHRAANGQVVAGANYDARTRAGGVNHIGVMLDPACAELAPFLVHYVVHGVQQMSPGRRIECAVKHWQEPVIAAATDAGFVKRYDGYTMGQIIQ